MPPKPVTVEEVLEGPEGQGKVAFCPEFGGGMKIINSEEQMSGPGSPKNNPELKHKTKQKPKTKEKSYER